MTINLNLALTIEDSGAVSVRVVQPTAPRSASDLDRLSRRILRYIGEYSAPVSKNQIYKMVGPADRPDDRFHVTWEHLVATQQIRVVGHNRLKSPLWVLSAP